MPIAPPRLDPPERPPRCRHETPRRLSYQGDQADTRRRWARGEIEKFCHVCERWVWPEYWWEGEEGDNANTSEPEMIDHTVRELRLARVMHEQAEHDIKQMKADIQCVHTAVRITTEGCDLCRDWGYCGTHERILSILGRWVEEK